MNKLTIANQGVKELSDNELQSINGGVAIAIAILLGIWVAVYIYNLVTG